jgi:hypothetical protein
LDQSDGLMTHRSDWGKQNRVHIIFEQGLGNLRRRFCN